LGLYSQRHPPICNANVRTEILDPAAARHDSGAQEDDDNSGELEMNNHRDAFTPRRFHHRYLASSDCTAPGQKFPGRNDRQQADDHKQAELGQKRVAVPVVSGALLEEEYPQQPDDQQRAGSDAEHKVGDLKPSRGGKRQFLTDQRELDRQRRDQRESAEVMQEGKERGHVLTVNSVRKLSTNGFVKFGELMGEQRRQQLLHLCDVNSAFPES
jgi:hypothetical protein